MRQGALLYFEEPGRDGSTPVLLVNRVGYRASQYVVGPGGMSMVIGQWSKWDGEQREQYVGGWRRCRSI